MVGGKLSWPELLASHRREHRRHYGGLTLEVPLPLPDMPTDMRLAALRRGAADPALPLLYFNYGRYLLAAACANGAQPANLQGKWNEDPCPPWGSDLHHDVNLQMCYWPAEAAGLQAYTEALFTHIELLVPHGRRVARRLYGCREVYLPISIDPWGRATPEGYGWEISDLAGRVLPIEAPGPGKLRFRVEAGTTYRVTAASARRVNT